MRVLRLRISQILAVCPCSLVKITRYYGKIETDAERAAGEREWAAVTGSGSAGSGSGDGDRGPVSVMSAAAARPAVVVPTSWVESAGGARLLILLVVVAAVWLPEMFVALGALLLAGLCLCGSALRRMVVDSDWFREARTQHQRSIVAKHSRHTFAVPASFAGAAPAPRRPP